MASAQLLHFLSEHVVGGIVARLVSPGLLNAGGDVALRGYGDGRLYLAEFEARVTVDARYFNIAQHHGVGARFHRGVHLDVDDGGIAFLEFQLGVVGRVADDSAGTALQPCSIKLVAGGNADDMPELVFNLTAIVASEPGSTVAFST